MRNYPGASHSVLHGYRTVAIVTANYCGAFIDLSKLNHRLTCKFVVVKNVGGSVEQGLKSGSRLIIGCLSECLYSLRSPYRITVSFFDKFVEMLAEVK